MFLFLICAPILFLYLLLVLILTIGWRRTAVYSPYGVEKSETNISVVVACKNEQGNLQSLLSCLAQQSFQNFQLVLVDDHSTDNTLKIMERVKSSFPDIQIVRANGFGKKNVLKEGIELATGDFIVTTDADCLPSYHWLETIVSFQNRYVCDLIICPVRLIYDESFFGGLQMLEFTSLVASGAGAAGVGMPILCNGANLAFRKSEWNKSITELKENEMSGDDIFLLQSVKGRGGRIRFLKSQSAFVSTSPAETLSEFLNQRRRWASKSPSYTDWHIIATACIVFAVNALLLALIVLQLYSPEYWKQLFFVGGVKYFTDTLFLYSAKKFFQLRHVWFFSIFLSILYPYYVVLVAVSSFVFKPKRWK